MISPLHTLLSRFSQNIMRFPHFYCQICVVWLSLCSSPSLLVSPTFHGLHILPRLQVVGPKVGEGGCAMIGCFMGPPRGLVGLIKSAPKMHIFCHSLIDQRVHIFCHSVIYLPIHSFIHLVLLRTHKQVVAKFIPHAQLTISAIPPLPHFLANLRGQGYI